MPRHLRSGGGAGIDGERSGMWTEMARIIREVRPSHVFVENSPMLTTRGLGRVLGDLASMGFDAQWGVLGAADVGANHQRDRIWISAHSNSVNVETAEMVGAKKVSRQLVRTALRESAKVRAFDWSANQPSMVGMADGVADWVDRAKAIGNGQVPLCAATAWRVLSDHQPKH